MKRVIPVLLIVLLLVPVLACGAAAAETYEFHRYEAPSTLSYDFSWGEHEGMTMFLYDGILPEGQYSMTFDLGPGSNFIHFVSVDPLFVDFALVEDADMEVYASSSPVEFYGVGNDGNDYPLTLDVTFCLLGGDDVTFLVLYADRVTIDDTMVQLVRLDELDPVVTMDSFVDDSVSVCGSIRCATKEADTTSKEQKSNS